MILPHVTPAMLTPDYWLARTPHPDAALCPPEAITAFNAHVPDVLGVPDVLSVPDSLPAASVRAALYPLPEQTRFDVNGAPIPAAFWDGIRRRMALDALPDPAPARFALAARRLSLRSLPTDHSALKAPDEIAFDRLQETTLDLGWPLAVFHTSADGAWAFALTPGYWGWVRARQIAYADRAAVADFVNAAATGGAFALAVDPWSDLARPGESHHRAAQMGSRFPLAARGPHVHRVQIPTADADGRLAPADGFFAADDPGWAAGFLPFTPRTLITRAFAVLGEPYAWGGLRLGRVGRDCSRFVRDVYATAGVFLPRNGDDQEAALPPRVTFTPEDDHAARLGKLESVPAGALLFLPGHVMLHLGMVDGVPYAIHDLWHYAHPEGHVTRAAQVVVSALPRQPSAAGHTLLERLTSARWLG